MNISDLPKCAKWQKIQLFLQVQNHAVNYVKKHLLQRIFRKQSLLIDNVWSIGAVIGTNFVCVCVFRGISGCLLFVGGTSHWLHFIIILLQVKLFICWESCLHELGRSPSLDNKFTLLRRMLSAGQVSNSGLPARYPLRHASPTAIIYN